MFTQTCYLLNTGELWAWFWKNKAKAKKTPHCVSLQIASVPTNRLDKIIIGYLSLAYFVMHWANFSASSTHEPFANLGFKAPLSGPLPVFMHFGEANSRCQQLLLHVGFSDHSLHGKPVEGRQREALSFSRRSVRLQKNKWEGQPLGRRARCMCRINAY